MFHRGHSDVSNGHEMGVKRQRVADHLPPPPPFYGASSSNYVFNSSSCSSHNHSSQPPCFPVVRLRGLPYDCTENSVAEFFHGLNVVDVLFVRKGGKFTGEAFCVLGYALQVDFALQRNHQNIGTRYVEIFRSRRQDYYKAIANELSDLVTGWSPRQQKTKFSDAGKDSSEHTGILRLRGLPFSVCKNDITEFFKDFVISDDSVRIVVNTKGKATGEAFVEFATAQDSKSAMAKDRMMLGNRYVELFPSTMEELNQSASSFCSVSSSSC